MAAVKEQRRVAGPDACLGQNLVLDVGDGGFATDLDTEPLVVGYDADVEWDRVLASEFLILIDAGGGACGGRTVEAHTPRVVRVRRLSQDVMKTKLGVRQDSKRVETLPQRNESSPSECVFVGRGPFQRRLFDAIRCWFKRTFQLRFTLGSRWFVRRGEREGAGRAVVVPFRLGVVTSRLHTHGGSTHA